MGSGGIDETPGRTRRQALVLLASLCGANLFNFMDRVLISVFLEDIKADLALSDTQMGLVSGLAFAALYGAAVVFFGRIADTGNRTRTLAAMLAFWSAASAACGQAQGFFQLAAARAAVGAGIAACPACANSLIADAFPPERRAAALGVFSGVGTIGTALGLALGGMLAQAYGWRAAFVILAVPGVAFAAFMAAAVREPARGRYDAATAPEAGFAATLKRLARSRDAMLVAAAMPCLMFTAGVAAWIPAFLQRAHAVSVAEVGAATGASLGLGLVAGTLAGGWIASALRRRDPAWEFRQPAIACLASIPAFTAFYMASDPNAAYALLFTAFGLQAAAFAPGLACILTVADARSRGSLVGITALATSVLAYGIGPAYVGAASDVLSLSGLSETAGDTLRWPLIGGLAVPAAGAVLFLLAGKAHGQGNGKGALSAP